MVNNEGNTNVEPNTLINFKECLNQAQIFEENGQINDAITLYEKLIFTRFIDSKPYDRLIILYRKKREKENEIRILKLAIETFHKNDKYQIRLSKIPL